MAEFVEVIKQAERLCHSYKDCDKCELSDRCSLVSLDSSVEVEEYEKIVMEWAKENPEITNNDKLFQIIKDTFGEEVAKGLEYPGVKENCKYFGCPTISCDCRDCKFKGFWNKPYVEPKESE